MKTPPFLRKGDTIGIAAPGKSVKPQDIFPCVEMLEKQGFKVVLGENIFNVYHQFAGTDEQRILDFNKMLNEPEVKAVLCARGGYGTVRIIDRLDFKNFASSPKWILGFSDVTVLHNHIHSGFKTATIHSGMAVNFPKDGIATQQTETIVKAITGESLNYSTPAFQLNKSGSARGEIIGGNLSILHTLTGTSSMPDTAGKILLLEDVSEYLYHIDRMMQNLKRSGCLTSLAGIIVGGFTDIKDSPVPFGMNVQEIILETVKDYDYPVCFNFPSGHMADNHAVYFGIEAKMEVSEKGGNIFYAPQIS
jgi:muramoyltetrapeptide carboxypeptidase